jgi:hypothetical protein
MTRRTKGEQKAYLDGYEMCADCIEKYLSDEGKQKLNCLLMAVRNAVEVEDIESEEAAARTVQGGRNGFSHSCQL